MSRIGRKPVAVPGGVSVELKKDLLSVKGPKGEMRVHILPEVQIVIAGDAVTVTRTLETADARARHGLIRVLIANAILGVTKGYEKQLEIIGVGYKAQLKPLDTARGKVQTLVLNLGHSHPINFQIPEGLEIAQDEKNKNILFVRGIDKQLVGQAASDIRSLRPPEPYKGKGIRYVGEVVRKKAGKAVVAKTAA